MEWEYNAIQYKYTEEDRVTAMLNKQGMKGWELVNSIFIGKPNYFLDHIFIFLKDPKNR